MADHKDYWTTAGDQGAIKISEDVIASIAALAVSEAAGVSGLYSSFTSDIASFLSKKNLARGVKVVLGEDDHVALEISYLAKFGYNICDVAKDVQEAVRSSIMAMTGLKTSSINIHVGGVTFEADEADDADVAFPKATERSEEL